MIALIVIAALFASFVALLIADMIRDHRDPQRDRAPHRPPRPFVRSGDPFRTEPGQALTPTRPDRPAPLSTRDIIGGLHNELERITTERDELAELVDQLLTDLEIRPPAHPIIRYLRDHGPATTAQLVDRLDLDLDEAHTILIRSSDDRHHPPLITDREHRGELIWTFNRDHDPVDRFHQDRVVVDAELLDTTELTAIEGTTIRRPLPPILQGTRS